MEVQREHGTMVGEDDTTAAPLTRQRVKTILGTILAVCLFMALDMGVVLPHSSSSAAAEPESVVSQPHVRRLQDKTLAEQAQDIIKENMDAGNYGRNNSQIVGISWVPLEDLEDDDEPVDRGTSDDDGLDRVWIIVMSVAGVTVCCLIGLAFACLLKAQREIDQDENKEEDDSDEENGAETNDEEEDEEEDSDDDEQNNGNIIPVHSNIMTATNDELATTRATGDAPSTNYVPSSSAAAPANRYASNGNNIPYSIDVEPAPLGQFEVVETPDTHRYQPGPSVM